MLKFKYAEIHIWGGPSRPLNISMQQAQGPVSSGGAVHKLSESEESWSCPAEVHHEHEDALRCRVWSNMVTEWMTITRLEEGWM